MFQNLMSKAKRVPTAHRSAEVQPGTKPRPANTPSQVHPRSMSTLSTTKPRRISNVVKDAEEDDHEKQIKDLTRDKTRQTKSKMGRELYQDFHQAASSLTLNEDEASPDSLFCLSFCSILSFVMVAIFVAVAFASFKTLPVLTPDVYTFAGISWVCTFLRFVYSGSYWKTYTILAMTACALSFTVNYFAYQTAHNMLFDSLVNGTVMISGSGILNRTVTNYNDANFVVNLWEAQKNFHITIMFFECVTALCLLPLTAYTLRNKARQVARLSTHNLQDERIQHDAKILRGCNQCLYGIQHCVLPSTNVCCPVRETPTSRSGWSELILLPLSMLGVLVLMVILGYIGLVMASAIEGIPCWTTIHSPHIYLITGLLLLTLTPIGETYYRSPKTKTYLLSWVFLFGYFFLCIGCVMSMWALILDAKRVADSGAAFLAYDTYVSKLDCTGAKTLAGGYTYACNSLSGKLATYALAHHVFELLLVLLGLLFLALLTLLFCVDFGNNYERFEEMYEGPTPEHLYLTPFDTVRSIVETASDSTSGGYVAEDCQQWLGWMLERRSELEEGMTVDDLDSLDDWETHLKRTLRRKSKSSEGTKKHSSKVDKNSINVVVQNTMRTPSTPLVRYVTDE